MEMKKSIANIVNCVVALGLLASSGTAAAQMRGTISGPGERSFPVAVAPLQSPQGGSGGELGEKFADILSRDLTLSGLFRPIDRKAFLEKENSGVTAETINFANWSVIGAIALVKGTIEVSADKIVVEARVFDVFQRRQLTGRRYHGERNNIRRMAHRFADEILKHFTGERGPFDTRISYISTRSGRFKEMYVMSMDGGDVQQLTAHRGIVVSPSWSRDGRHLYFTSYKRRNPDFYRFDLISGVETQMSNRRGLNLGGRVSPDGSRIALTVEDQGNTDLVLLSQSGSLLQRLTDSYAIDVSPSWSPDGRQIAFCSSRSGNPHIYVMDADGGGVRRVTMEGNYNTAPAWSPKGDKIAYVSREGGQFNVHVINIDGTGDRRLTTQGNNEDPSWSPDGRYLVFSSTRGGRRKLWVSDLTGASQVQLTDGNGDDSSPAWSNWLE